MTSVDGDRGAERIGALIALTRRGWAAPVLVAIASGRIARVAPLASALGASRAVIEQTLLHLLALGLLARNPGHGHPLRPEFVLTGSGRAAASAVDPAWRLARAAGAEAIMRKRWALPILFALAGPASYGALRRALEPVTDRALSMALRDLAGARLIARAVDAAAAPPASQYVATPRGLPIARALAAG